MAITATVVISASVATVTGLAGGTLVPGQTMTYAAQTQPVTPAVTLGSQITGVTGSNGTYNVNNLATLASSTVTFELWETLLGLPSPHLPSMSGGQGAPPVAPLATILKPPQPLPQTTFGSTVQTSFST